MAVVRVRWISTQIQRFWFKMGVAWGQVTQFPNYGTPLYLLNELSYPLQIWYTHRGRTPHAYGL